VKSGERLRTCRSVVKPRNPAAIAPAAESLVDSRRLPAGAFHADRTLRHHTSGRNPERGAFPFGRGQDSRLPACSTGSGCATSKAAIPGPTPRMKNSFAAPPELKLKQARLTAFGSTRRTGSTAATGRQPASPGQSRHACGGHPSARRGAACDRTCSRPRLTTIWP